VSRLLALLLCSIAQSLFGCVTNVIPFGVTTDQLVGKTIGDTFSLNDAGVGSGKEGKIDLVGYGNTGAWDADMLALGCGCQVCDGSYPVITGNVHVSTDFNAMGAGSVFIMPLVDQFTGGVSVNIVGFVLVKLLSSSGTGSHWTAALQLLSATFPLNDLDVDSDGDGLSDFQEFYTGTDPTNSSSFFGITSIAQESDDIRVTWMTGPGRTNALERAVGDESGSLSNNFAAIFTVTNTVGSATNYLDLGAATNVPAFYYRVRLVP
jgi:hypothetical protein